MPIANPDTHASRPGGKSPAAFRTIAEVAGELQLPAHVLRFWESKFPQIKPLKRRGGRRYYRPEDVTLLRQIRSLLYTDGYTIKGVQKLLRESSARPNGALRTEPGLAADAGKHMPPRSRRADKLAEVLAQLQVIRGLLRAGGS